MLAPIRRQGWRTRLTSSCLFNAGSEGNSPPDSPLNHTDLSRLQENHAKLGLDIQVSGLGAQQKVAVGVAESPLLHGCVDAVNVNSHALTQVRITRAAQGVQAIDKVYLFGALGKGERTPFCLFGQGFDFGIEGEEAVFNVGLALDCLVSVCTTLDMISGPFSE